MSTTSLAAVAAALLAGCSFVYDADDLRNRGDGGPGDMADADPEALHVFEVLTGGFLENGELLEGEGSTWKDGDDPGPAVPIVLSGQNMTDATVITVDGAGFDSEEVAATVSADGHWAAFALRVPLGLDEEGSLRIELVKGDESFTPRLVVVRDLTALERDGGEIDTDDLEAHYTHVVLTGDVEATGSAPLRLYATAGISIDGTLRADGVDDEPGPGGCAGGASGDPAQCGDGSGGGDTLSGGGGGFGTAGTEGADGAGAAGEETGDDYIVPLPPAEGAIAGAGGGGAGGAPGGGSGGVIELTTPAVMTLGSGTIVSASGGAGTEGIVACTTAGNGGGGSGGAILLRAGAALLALSDSRVEALGGAGGMGGSGCDGGNGGMGRIRIDSPGEPLPDDEPILHRGPAFAEVLPAVTDEAGVTVALRGRNNTDYEVILNGGGSPTVISTGDEGTGEDTVELEPGLNRLCVRVSPAADLIHPESKNCATVAYIPQ